MIEDLLTISIETLSFLTFWILFESLLLNIDSVMRRYMLVIYWIRSHYILVNVMKCANIILVLMALILLSTGGQALRTFSGDTISIDTPIADDVFAAGNMVSINAPVNSASGGRRHGEYQCACKR